MKCTKHIAIKAFSFLIISISAGYYDKMRSLIMSDTFVPKDLDVGKKKQAEYDKGYNSEDPEVNFDE